LKGKRDVVVVVAVVVVFQRQQSETQFSFVLYYIIIFISPSNILSKQIDKCKTYKVVAYHFLAKLVNKVSISN